MRLLEIDYIYPYTFEMKFTIQASKLDFEDIDLEDLEEWCMDNLEGKYHIRHVLLPHGDLCRFIWVTLSSESDSVLFKTRWQV